MRLSQNFTKTSKTAPADEIARNAQLLIRAGYIHKMMAGVYAYLPLGLRVIENIRQIVREEMNAVGGQEVQMTALQPRELWEKTDRWDDNKVDNWFKTTLKNGTELGVGLSHEEPIVDSLIPFVNSYKDLPVSVYQIQTKFRNELRAKSGLLRGREFMMKDLYSFARTQEEHTKLYEELAAAYLRVYDRLGIGADTYRTAADGGYFTDKFSDEFQTLTEVGEDTIYVDEQKRFAVNKEVMNDETLQKLGLSRDALVEKRAVEVGNIFPLESKYSDALGLYYVDENGERQSVIMGCYGIGISRVMGVIAEKFADDKGLVWPENIAPAKVYIVQIGEAARVVADELYAELMAKGIETIYDDRDERPGAKFADAELMGIPYRVTVSDRLLAQQQFEFTSRKTGETELLTHDALLAKLN
ncbi:MAG TPA: His/Gly/Thr/Pro-type tRNA ligase C-terminal domain-containing protein [Candidatus Saccharimonas sp.]|nr:His/Gly/Thr/Pro-type tRNA ligase C-terminal domain-containing protein [Candidatus Saccharimonas sp.]